MSLLHVHVQMCKNLLFLRLSVVFSYVDEIRADLISRKVGTALAGLTANFPENQVIDNYYYIDSAVLLTLISFAVDNCCK